MSSIDNRIVVLSFDNKDFERNVQTSMNTLDKLKNGLKLQGASDGLAKISASAKSFNLNPIGDAIDSIKERFSSLGIVGMTIIQNLTNKAVDFATNVFGKITSGGIKRAMNLEQANFMLEGLFGNVENKAEKVQEIMKAANDAVTGTSYGLDEAAKVASQLVASGIRDGEKMSFVLRGIAGTAAMTGGSYEELGNIFTTVAGSGKLMTEQLRQFEHRGLNVAATLGEQLGVTEQEIREMVHDGAIDFETFANAMADAFGEHAQEANKTFVGSLSNVRAALSRLGAKVATPSLERLRDIFNVLGPTIDQISAKLQPLIDFLNEKLGNAAMRAVEVLTKVYLALGGDVDKLRTKITYASDEAKEHVEKVISSYTGLSKKIGGELTDTADAADNAAKSIGKSAEEIEEAARKVLAGEYGTGDERRRQLEELGYSYEEVQNKVNELLGVEYRYEVQEKELITTTEEAAEQTEKLAKRAGTLNENLAKLTGSNFMKGLIGVVQAFFQVVRAGKEAFKSVFRGRDFLFAIERISEKFKALGQELTMTETETKGLQTVLEVFFRVIRNGLLILGKFIEYGLTIATGIAKIAKKILNFIGVQEQLNEKLGETSRRARFLDALRAVLKKLGDSFTAFKDKLKEVVAAVKETEGFKHLQESMSKLWETIKDLAGRVFDKVIEKMNAFAGADVDFSWLDKLVEILGKGAEKLASFIDECLNGFPTVKAFIAQFTEDENSRIGKFINFLIQAKDAIVGFITGAEPAEGKKLQIFETIKQMVSDAFTDIGEFFSNIKTGGFVEGVQSFISNLSEAFSGIDTEKLLKNIKTVGTIIVSLIFLRQISKNITALTGLFKSMSDIFGIRAIADAYKQRTKLMKFGMLIAAIGTIVASLYVLTTIPADDLERAVESLAVIIGGVVGVFVLIQKIPMKDGRMKDFAIAMAGLGVGVLALSAAAKVLADLPWKQFMSAAGKLGILIAMLTLSARLAGTVKAGAAFMGLAVAINLLIPAIVLLGSLPWKMVLRGAGMIGLVAVELGVAARLAGSVKAAAAFMGMAVAIDLLVPALLILGKSKWETILKGASALAMVMFSLAGAVKLADTSREGANNMLKMTIPLIAAIVGLYILKDIPVNIMITNAAALSGIMIAMAGAMKLAGTVESGSWNMVKALIPFAAVVASLYVLKDIPWETLLAAGVSISAVMLSIAGALQIAADANLEAALALDVMSLAVIPIAYSLNELRGYDWQSLLGAATALSEVVVAVAIAMRVFKSPDFVGTVESAAALGVSIDIIVALVTVLAGIFGEIEGLQGAVERGGEVLRAVGEAFGGLIAGFGEALTSTLPQIGENLSGFAESAKPFFDSMASFSSSVFDGVKTLSEAMLILTGAEFLEGIYQFFNGGESVWSEFGEELKSFGASFVDFAEDTKNIKGPQVATVADAIKSLATAAGEIPDEGPSMMKLLFGDNTLSSFGAELRTFGPQLSSFWNKTKAIQSGDLDGAANALTVMGKAAKEIPNEGVSLMQMLFGDNTLSNFGAELKEFGPQIIRFWAYGKQIAEGDLDGAANALSVMSKAASEIPDEGPSMMQLLFGDNTLSQFGAELKEFGPHLTAFYNEVQGMNSSKVEGAAQALTTMATAATSIPNGGLSVVRVFVGDNTLSKFGEELEKFGPHLSAFAGSIKVLELAKIKVAAESLPYLVQMSQEAASGNKDALQPFGDAIVYFGQKLLQHYISVRNIETGKIALAIRSVYSLIEVGNTMAYVDTTAMANFGNALKNVGVNGISEFCSAFSDGNVVMQAQNAVSGMISQATAYVDTSSFYYAGANCINGMINGLNAMAPYVYNTASIIAYNVANTVRSALSIHSPSRVMYEIGEYTIAGMVNAMQDRMGDVTRVSNKAGTTIIESVAKPLEQLQNVIDSNMDVSPVITPVLDLSDISNDANTIGSMLDRVTAPVSLSANLGGSMLDSIMSLADRIGAGATAQESVVNAISDIRRDIGSLSSAITRMQIRLDSGALVGELVDPIDQELGARLDMRGRGLY